MPFPGFAGIRFEQGIGLHPVDCNYSELAMVLAGRLDIVTQLNFLPAGSSIKQHGFPLFAPRILIGMRKRVEIGCRGGGIVHPSS